VTPRLVFQVEDRFGKVLYETPGWEPPVKAPTAVLTTPEPTSETATETPAPVEKPEEKKIFASLHELIPTKDEMAARDQILDPQAAFLINDILSDETVKLSTNLSIAGKTVATKTGTANKKKNNV